MTFMKKPWKRVKLTALCTTHWVALCSDDFWNLVSQSEWDPSTVFQDSVKDCYKKQVQSYDISSDDTEDSLTLFLPLSQSVSWNAMEISFIISFPLFHVVIFHIWVPAVLHEVTELSLLPRPKHPIKGSNTKSMALILKTCDQLLGCAIWSILAILAIRKQLVFASS